MDGYFVFNEMLKIFDDFFIVLIVELVESSDVDVIGNGMYVCIVKYEMIDCWMGVFEYGNGVWFRCGVIDGLCDWK